MLAERGGQGFGAILEILGQTKIASEPRECVLHHPAPRQHDKASQVVGAPDDFAAQVRHLGRNILWGFRCQAEFIVYVDDSVETQSRPRTWEQRRHRRNKVVAQNGRLAARPSGTEAVYKIYAESFRGAAHVRQIQHDAQALVARLFGTTEL